MTMVLNQWRNFSSPSSYFLRIQQRCPVVMYVEPCMYIEDQQLWRRGKKSRTRQSRLMGCVICYLQSGNSSMRFSRLLGYAALLTQRCSILGDLSRSTHWGKATKDEQLKGKPSSCLEHVCMHSYVHYPVHYPSTISCIHTSIHLISHANAYAVHAMLCYATKTPSSSSNKVGSSCRVSIKSLKNCTGMEISAHAEKEKKSRKKEK